LSTDGIHFLVASTKNYLYCVALHSRPSFSVQPCTTCTHQCSATYTVSTAEPHCLVKGVRALVV